ncbi:MAG: FAD binding domain-containing protein [Rhizobiaceae bacterium]|nr:FAD binding domain-containing protein [Rhizobiaceae bacterium]
MYPSAIQNYEAPDSLDGAMAAIAKFGDDAHFIAGGQSLMQAIKSRIIQPQTLIDLQNVQELRTLETAQGVTIGAMVRYRDIAGNAGLDGRLGALRDAASHVGDRQVRNRGTIGGSLCWNFVSACMPTVTLALDPRLTLGSESRGRREVGIDDFLGEPMETDRQEDELLISIFFPQLEGRHGSAYGKWSLLTDGLPVIGVCASVSLDEGNICKSARISVGGLETGPVRFERAEEALVGVAYDDAKSHEGAISIAAEEAEILDDVTGDEEFRRQLIRSVGLKSIVTAFERAAAAGGGQ